MNIPIDLEQSLMDYAEQACEAGKKWVRAKEQADLLEKMKDIKFQDITDRQEGKTNAERERKAIVSEEWQNYVNNILTAEQLKSSWKIQYDNQVRFWDTTRSILASKNAERRFIAWNY